MNAMEQGALADEERDRGEDNDDAKDFDAGVVFGVSSG